MKIFIKLFFLFSFICVSCKEKPLIFIDPGHGGVDLGAVIKKPKIEEKRYTLITAHLTKRYLENLGYRVSLTRSRDFFISLRRRVDLANKKRSKIFLSIHFNSCPNKRAHGIEIYYYKKLDSKFSSSKKLADSVLNKIIFLTKAKRRGVKRGNYFVLRETKMPSILIEAGFLTNAYERNKICQREYLRKLSKGIADGVDRFLKKF